jgi:fused signal recognition particle receptor
LTAAEGGFLARLTARVNRGASWALDLLPGRRIDAALLEELETKLLAADVGVEATASILEDLRGKVARAELADAKALEAALAASLLAILAPVERPLAVDRARKPFVILVVGVNGSGKTTTIGKLAHKLKRQGHRPLLAAADTFRAGAIDQLRIWAERVGADFVGALAGADPASVAFDAIDAAHARNADVVIVDTAGRLHTQEDLMAELAKVGRVIARRAPGAPHETLLVLDATVGQNAVAQARTFNDALDLSGLILAKLDSTARGGIVVALKQEFDLPVKLVGTGEGIDELEPFDPQRFAHDVLTG